MDDIVNKIDALWQGMRKRTVSFKENQWIQGKFIFDRYYTPTGEHTGHWEIPNKIVTAGVAWLATFMTGGGGNAIDWIGVGWGVGANTAPTEAQTDLQGANKLRRQISTNGGTRSVIASGTNRIANFSVNFPAGVGTGNWEESGIFDAAAAGNMFCRQIFGAIAKGALDSITVQWQATLQTN